MAVDRYNDQATLLTILWIYILWPFFFFCFVPKRLVGLALRRSYCRIQTNENTSELLSVRIHLAYN